MQRRDTSGAGDFGKRGRDEQELPAKDKAPSLLERLRLFSNKLRYGRRLAPKAAAKGNKPGLRR